MEANCDKSQFILSCNKPSTPVINSSSIETNTKEMLLGITTDKDLKFDDHYLCKKMCQNITALARLSPHMNVGKIQIIMKAFKES